MTRRRAVVCRIGCARLVVGIAFLPVTAASGQDEPLLSGPQVQAGQSDEASLVRRDFNGRLVRLERPAEVAALEHIEIDDGLRARIERILVERNAVMDAIVRENIPLLTELQAVGQSENKLEVLRVLGKLNREMRPLRQRGTLREEIVGELEKSGMMDAGAVERFESLVDGYWRAYVEDVQVAASEMGEDVNPRQAKWRARLEQTGEEIKRAYERIVQGDGGQFERVLASLDLTESQEAEVRRLIEEFVQQTLLNPTQKEERRLFFRIASKLTPEQRRKLLQQFDKD